MDVVDHIFVYVKCTLHLGMRFWITAEMKLIRYIDSDFVGCVDT